MNILIPHSWLKDFVKTDATPKTIAEKLSLCSLSVAKLHKKEGDTVYEIETTPNRYDTLSVLGVAREVAAVLPRNDGLIHLRGGKTTGLESNKANLLNVTIASPELCPRFTALVLDNVEIKPSPKVIQERLEMSGVRALNNVVDVSNYLMLELGQPMHIFDFDKIVDGEMILRESKKGEPLTTLDGAPRIMPEGAIVIESGGKLVDLCGIMGGENSAVDENTKRILVFIQIYDPLRIRKTSQELALRTEASTRFEKGIDPEGIIPAMNRAVEMLKENAGAKVASKLIDIKNEAWQPHEVELEIPEVERLLGIRLEKEEIIEILKSLGFEIRVQNSAFQIPTIIAKVPSWRDKDITIPADLIEEIARLYGYHNLPAEMPTGAIPSTPQEKKFYWEDKAKDFLKHQGFYEVYNYSFVSEEALQTVAARHASLKEKAMKVRNPLNTDLEYLRPSLLPSLLQNLSENQHLMDELKLFELERIYLPVKGQELPQENFRLTGLIFNQQLIDSKNRRLDRTMNNEQFYVVKGIVEGLLKELGITDYKLEPQAQNPATATLTHPSPLGYLEATPSEVEGSGVLGTIGYIKNSVTAFDLDFDIISELAADRKTYEPIPEYPPIIEDLSIILPPKTVVADVISLIKKQSDLIKNIEIIDRYPEKGSVTLRLIYQHARRTLTDAEVAAVRQKIITALERNLKAKVRQKERT